MNRAPMWTNFETNFYKLLGDINKDIAIMLVSHDVGTIISLVKNIACVNQGLHYHSGSNISQEWLNNAYESCPSRYWGTVHFHTGCCCNTIIHIRNRINTMK